MTDHAGDTASKSTLRASIEEEVVRRRRRTKMEAGLEGVCVCVRRSEPGEAAHRVEASTWPGIQPSAAGDWLLAGRYTRHMFC